MKSLFLHGWRSLPGGVKPTLLAECGHTVINPQLDDDDFESAIRTAQTEYDKHRPQVIVGSSRGGAVAMNIDSGETPLVLLCPAWKNWGATKKLKPNSQNRATPLSGLFFNCVALSTQFSIHYAVNENPGESALQNRDLCLLPALKVPNHVKSQTSKCSDE